MADKRDGHVDRLTWADVRALVLIVVAILGLLYLFADAIDGEAAFKESRLAAHQQECWAAQEEVRLAEVTR